MSASNSSSSVQSNWDVGTPYEIEDEHRESEKSGSENEQGTSGGHVGNVIVEAANEIGAYCDEPIADEAWIRDYYRKKEEENERMRELQLRWDRTKPVTLW